MTLLEVVPKNKIASSKDILSSKDETAKSSFAELLKNITIKESKVLEASSLATKKTPILENKNSSDSQTKINTKSDTKNNIQSISQPKIDLKDIPKSTQKLETLLQNIQSKDDIQTKSETKTKIQTISQPKTDLQNIPKSTQKLETLLQNIPNKNDTQTKSDTKTKIQSISQPKIDLQDIPKSTQKLDTLLQDIPTKDDIQIQENKNPIEGLLKLFNNDALIEPKTAETLTNKDVKLLIADAKVYLKQKIKDNKNTPNLDTKELPKTLKSLDTFAQTLGIDTKKITLQEVKVINEELKQQVLKLPTATLKVSDKIIQAKEKVEKIEQSEPLEQLLKVFAKKEIEENTLKKQPIQEIKHQEIKTKNSKNNGLKQNTKTIKIDNNLNQTTQITPSIQTPPTITPMADATRKLEALLNSKREGTQTKKESSDIIKNEAITTTQKVDNLDIKLNEAKQMVKYLSSDVKSAIDDYKSPFTRVKVQLNPEKLGDVDLTVVQRGKNLHVNISSNNSAINTLSMNINELRVQLNNSGINNATINFNNSEQNFSNSGNEQNRQNEQQNAKKEYNYFDNEEQNEEIISSVEIIVPNYA